jgi:hypothetical protein
MLKFKSFETTLNYVHDGLQNRLNWGNTVFVPFRLE